MRYVALTFLITCLGSFQNCGPVNFSASGDLGSGGNVNAFGNPNGLPGLPDEPTTAPEQKNLICNFQSISKINWDQTPVNTNLPDQSQMNQSSGVDFGPSNRVDIEANSGPSFIVESAELLASFSRNSGPLVANARNVSSISGGSGSIDLNAVTVGEISSLSAEHICVEAHLIKELSHYSSGNVVISSTGSTGTLHEISSSSSGKLVLINMNVDTITAGSGRTFIQGGHIGLISSTSGDLYLDNVTVDQLTASSSTVHLINGAQVLNRN